MGEDDELPALMRMMNGSMPWWGKLAVYFVLYIGPWASIAMFLLAYELGFLGGGIRALVGEEIKIMRGLCRNDVAIVQNQFMIINHLIGNGRNAYNGSEIITRMQKECE